MTPLVDNIIESNPIWGTVSSIYKTVQPFVLRVSVFCLKVIAQSTLVYLMPGISFYSFVVGFILSDKVREISKKVDTVFDSCKTPLEKYGLALAIGFYSLYTLPFPLVVATMYYSAKWGAYLYHASDERLRRYQSNLTLPD
ncbi:MAG: hypothetical protein H0W88_10735 [Parachlamydiaceae bacterium]|nr:hypothetical protein [Parachlamydiaceae bacterium]